MKRTGPRACCGAVLLLLLATGDARGEPAAPVAESKAHFVRGSKLYDLGRYAEAAAEYEKAFELIDDPALLFNLGQAYRLGGDRKAALRSYRAYLRRSPGARNRTQVEAYIAELERAADAPPATPPPVPPSAAPAPAPATLPPLVPPAPSAPPPGVAMPTSASPPASETVVPDPPSPAGAAAPAATPAASASPVAVIGEAPPRPRSRAWIAGVVVPSVVVLGLVIGLAAYYGSPAPAHTTLEPIVP